MRVFLLDLWLDLREKRLAPVALALLAGIIVIPLALAQSAPEPPPPPPAQTAQNGEDPSLPEVASLDEADLESRLESFDPRDPFEPTSAARVPAGDGGAATTGGTGDGGTGTTGGGDAQTDSSGGGTTGGADTGPTGGGDTGTGTGTTGGTQQQRRTVFFTYTVDVTFGEFGEERRRRRVRRLALLPNEDNPVVVFLGVTTSGRTAVFLVDDGYEATGDGVCRPSPEDCTFLYLRADRDRDTALLTSEDGIVYRLRLHDIDRVAVGAGAEGEDDNTSRGERPPGFTGSTRDPAPPGEPEGESSREPERSGYRSPDFADGGTG